MQIYKNSNELTKVANAYEDHPLFQLTNKALGEVQFDMPTLQLPPAFYFIESVRLIDIYKTSYKDYEYHTEQSWKALLNALQSKTSKVDPNELRKTASAVFLITALAFLCCDLPFFRNKIATELLKYPSKRFEGWDTLLNRIKQDFPTDSSPLSEWISNYLISNEDSLFSTIERQAKSEKQGKKKKFTPHTSPTFSSNIPLQIWSYVYVKLVNYNWLPEKQNDQKSFVDLFEGNPNEVILRWNSNINTNTIYHLFKTFLDNDYITLPENKKSGLGKILDSHCTDEFSQMLHYTNKRDAPQKDKNVIDDCLNIIETTIKRLV